MDDSNCSVVFLQHGPEALCGTEIIVDRNLLSNLLEGWFKYLYCGGIASTAASSNDVMPTSLTRPMNGKWIRTTNVILKDSLFHILEELCVFLKIWLYLLTNINYELDRHLIYLIIAPTVTIFFFITA